ncbi:MAG: dTDP-4-dehydrorhamnose reductase [Candidatus Eisenbacteria bacterium]|uniref:dTDP-4-dehydrorhamnose reductase n=1 Tax=Eiseniibacteriota bacterium TaxID=2212470 RepID=A0A849ST39_UNCEI|nr:dTDP-4-dehydrorhamnose reductase [Candidatus Eisenbacteria bacterium]
MRIAITGAAGMLGQAAVPAFERAGHQVLGLDRSRADVTKLGSLREACRDFRPQWIVHLAAFTRVDDCESNADLAFLVNGVGAGNAAQVAAEHAAGVVAISSDYVFDGRADAPYREWDATAPRSVYGASKRAGEQAVRHLNPRHVVVRTSWLFGHGGPNFVDTMLRKARAGDALKVVDDQRGSPTYTVDLADALTRLVAAGACGTAQVTNRGDCTWYGFARYFLDRAGLAGGLGPTDSAAFVRPAPRPAYSVMSPLWYEHVTGARMPDWQDAVDRYLDEVAQ